jgi:UDP-glucose 4-epimerase
MSFQAYLDNIEEKTGKTPNEFIAMAKAKGFTNETKAGEILAWLKNDYALGRGHGMALIHVIKNGAKISEKHVNSKGAHRDPSDTLVLTGKKKS